VGVFTPTSNLLCDLLPKKQAKSTKTLACCSYLLLPLIITQTTRIIELRSKNLTPTINELQTQGEG
jgi:hypothetical protein